MFLSKPDVLCTQQNEICLNIFHILAMASVFEGRGNFFDKKILIQKIKISDHIRLIDANVTFGT